MKESFVFYRSFFEAIKDVPKENQLEIYSAIADYALNQKEPELNGIANTLWILIKPQISANYKKSFGGKYGKLGGRPPKEKPIGLPKEKPIGLSKNNPNDNVNVNVNDNVNVNEKEEKKIHTPPKNYFETQLKNSFTWLEQNCRTFRIDLPKCNTLLEQFISEQKAADNFDHRDFGDLKKHFSNWLKIQLEKQKKNNSTDKTHKISEPLPRA